MVDAVVLCGGFGSRLKEVSGGKQKCMMQVGKHPMLEHVLAQLHKLGVVSRVFLAAGFNSESIDLNLIPTSRLVQTIVVVEDQPLGTGGAIKNVMRKHELTEIFIVANGDSHSEVDKETILTLINCYNEWDVAIGVVEVSDTSRYGSIEVDHQGRVRSFREKSTGVTVGWINSGFYMFRRNVMLDRFQKCVENSFSLENQILPPLIDESEAVAIEMGDKFIDIGIPSDYSRSHKLFI